MVTESNQSDNPAAAAYLSLITPEVEIIKNLDCFFLLLGASMVGFAASYYLRKSWISGSFWCKRKPKSIEDYKKLTIDPNLPGNIEFNIQWDKTPSEDSKPQRVRFNFTNDIS